MYIPRKGLTRTAGLAVAVFAVGAGLGWTFADMLFGSTSAPTPMVAAIRFEDAHLDAIPAPPLYDSFIAVPPQFPSRPQVSVNAQDNAGPVDEERRLAQALEWAERYRHRQNASARSPAPAPQQREAVRVAAVEASRWSDVAEHANRIRQPHADIQKLVAAQGEQKSGTASEQKVASAGPALVAASGPLGQTAHTQAVRCENCGRKPVQNHARRATKVRTAARHSRRATAVKAQPAFMCPLRWLEAAVMGERRKPRRYTG